MSYDIGIYITDASFDKDTHIASVSFVEITKNRTGEKHIKCNNIFEAEFQGIKECMIHASTRFNNIVIICDSKQAIKEAKKELYHNKKWNRKIKDIQLIWLPREFTDLADFLTKNIQNPEDNKNKKIESFEEDLERHNVMEIFVTEEDKKNILRGYLKELHEKYDLNEIFFKNKKFEKLIKKGELISLYEEDISEDIVRIIEKNPELISQQGLLNKIITIASFSLQA